MYIGALSSVTVSENFVSVSIRAPTGGAMATHSKIRPFQALTYPYVRPLREKGCRFYNHFGFAYEPFLAHPTIICVAVVNFGRHRKTTSFWSNHVTQPSNGVDITTQSITSPNLSFWVIQSLASTGFFPSARTARANRLMYIGALSSVTVSEKLTSEPHIILTCAVPSPNTFALIIDPPRNTA